MVRGGSSCCTTGCQCDDFALHHRHMLGNAGETQNLPTVPKLTSLTVPAVFDSISYVAATRAGEFGLPVRLPQNFLLHCVAAQAGLCFVSRGRMGTAQVFTVSAVLGPTEVERCQARPRPFPCLFIEGFPCLRAYPQTAPYLGN